MFVFELEIKILNNLLKYMFLKYFVVLVYWGIVYDLLFIGNWL